MGWPSDAQRCSGATIQAPFLFYRALRFFRHLTPSVHKRRYPDLGKKKNIDRAGRILCAKKPGLFTPVDSHRESWLDRLVTAKRHGAVLSLIQMMTIQTFIISTCTIKRACRCWPRERSCSTYIWSNRCTVLPRSDPSSCLSLFHKPSFFLISCS